MLLLSLGAALASAAEADFEQELRRASQELFDAVAPGEVAGRGGASMAALTAGPVAKDAGGEGSPG